jgi:hypothetical protein
MPRPRTGIITMSRDNTKLVIPVNPPSIPIGRKRDYRDVDIVNFRTVGRFGNRKLADITWQSFFPAVYDSYCNYGPTGLLTPAQYGEIISNWQQLDPPAPVFVSITGWLVETWFAITEFNTEDRAGEPGDIYYTLTLKEYVHTSSSIFNVGAPPRAPAPPNSDPGAPQPGSYYDIVPGDTLWGIAKTAYGDGSLWPTIWDANQPMTSGNPNLIYPGEHIIIPTL